MRFSSVELAASDFTGLREFYCDLLGMVEIPGAQGLAFGFSHSGCRLEFLEILGQPHKSGPSDFYWKIGITVRNLDHAVNWLHKNGWPVSKPHQFRDIGYLCHLSDPCGFTIELLQQGFEGNESAAGPGHAIAGQAVLAHITLRVVDIEAAHHFCGQELALQLMSVQPVTDFGFCLYFYGFEDEQPPSPDLASVSNREWLWQRPYTILELQHLQAPGAGIIHPKSGSSGFRGMTFTTKEGDCLPFSVQKLAPGWGDQLGRLF